MTLRQNTTQTLGRMRTKPTLAAAAALGMLTLAACGGPVEASGDVRMGAADGAATRVVARDNEFEPTTLELPSGSKVTIEVVNEGHQAHNLVIDDITLSTGTLEPGQVATATLTVPDAPVTYYCSFHPGMEGRLKPVSG
ncbi:MAG: hypothetical protein GEU74_16940 [Nitriliruptorales bacterium]|nr:hypothetical protein [Nitriliruptorales bacterium]